jgi:glutathione synthase
VKLAFVVNGVATEQSDYTTVRLAWRAVNAGHRVAFIGLEDFIYEPSGAIAAVATLPSQPSYASDREFLQDLQRRDARSARIAVDGLDILMLRSNPADEMGARDWAPTTGLLFAELSAANGVIVLNDPTHLLDAANKTYFQSFPEAVRPLTCITRHAAEIKHFIATELDGTAIIKPLQGSGGHGVFVVRPADKPNLNQMIDAVIRDGYALVQEYLPLAAEGDLRLLMLNGRALQVDGTYACLRRIASDSDARSNVTAGGTVALEQPDERALALAELLGPKLVRDGMHLVGLDVVGDKLMEINVATPGGVNRMEDLTGVDFSAHILADLERKVRLRHHYGSRMDNTMLATL